MKNKWWIVIALLQGFILLGIAGSYYAADYYGKKIVLKTEPVDPSDLFYGDYVTLNYEISDVSSSLWKGKPIQDPKPVYVVLSPNKESYHVNKITSDRPDVAGNQVYLKAKATPSMTGRLHLEYGLERYFVKDNSGKSYEDPQNKYKVTLHVSSWGKGVIKKVEKVNK